MRLQITKFGELPQVALCRCCRKAEVIHNGFRCESVLVGHKYQNIDQVLCQRRLYLPFIDHFLLSSCFIDHFLLDGINKLLNIGVRN